MQYHFEDPGGGVGHRQNFRKFPGKFREFSGNFSENSQKIPDTPRGVDNIWGGVSPTPRGMSNMGGVCEHPPWNFKWSFLEMSFLVRFDVNYRAPSYMKPVGKRA